MPQVNKSTSIVQTLHINNRTVELEIRPIHNKRMLHGRAFVFSDQNDPNSFCRDVVNQTLDHVRKVTDNDFVATHHLKAGCSCGCSPGWILKGYNHELFITIK